MERRVEGVWGGVWMWRVCGKACGGCVGRRVEGVWGGVWRACGEAYGGCVGRREEGVWKVGTGRGEEGRSSQILLHVHVHVHVTWVRGMALGFML